MRYNSSFSTTTFTHNFTPLMGNGLSSRETISQRYAAITSYQSNKVNSNDTDLLCLSPAQASFQEPVTFLSHTANSLRSTEIIMCVIAVIVLTCN